MFAAQVGQIWEPDSPIKGYNYSCDPHHWVILMSWPNALEHAHTSTAANKPTALLVAWVCSSCGYYIAWYLTVLTKDWYVFTWECSVTHRKICYRTWHSAILAATSHTPHTSSRTHIKWLTHTVSVLSKFHTAIWNMPVKHTPSRMCGWTL